MTPLEAFNAAPTPEAEQLLLTCCGSRAWAQSLIPQRPFNTPEALITAAESTWFALPEPAWLEALAAHPRIGESRAPATNYLAHSAQEQAAAQQTLAPVATRLIELNALYEEKFGFRYIIFASGRTAPELLQILESRLTQTRAEELHEAARQQHHITHLRMTKWLYP